MTKDSPKFPAIEDAIEYIKTKIDQHLWNPADKLPPVRDLARMAGVSAPTVCKAIAALRKEGVVKGAAHRRVQVTGEARKPPTPDENAGRHSFRTATAR